MSGQKIRCDECVYWEGETTAVGTCHRHPPTISGDSQWPMVDAYDWCGEFKGAGSLVVKEQPKKEEHTCNHQYPVYYCSDCCHITVSRGDSGNYRLVINTRYPLKKGTLVVHNIPDQKVVWSPDTDKELNCDFCKRPHARPSDPGTTCGWCRQLVRAGERHHPTEPCCDCTIEHLPVVRGQALNTQRTPYCLCGGVGCNSCEPGGRG